MQPRQTVPNNGAGIPDPSSPDLDDVKRQLALAYYFYRRLKELDVEVIPEKFFDQETKLLYREILKRHRANQAPEVLELFKMPFTL